LAAALAATNPALRTFDLVARQSSIGYEIAHTLHEIKGTSTAVEGKVVVQPDGRAQTMIRAAVASFKSGDANRDVHMLEVVEGDKHPFIVLKAVSPFVEPAPGAAKVPVELKAQLEFHGTRRVETIPLALERLADGRLLVTGRFVISLEAYGIERPSLMFVELPDETTLHVRLVLEETRP
jgi:polyisoprenoid-binding protein YceI